MRRILPRLIISSGICLALLALTPTNIFANTIFSDNFNDISGKTLTEHNNTWVAYPIGYNDAIVSDNKAKSNGTDSTYHIPSLYYLTDYCVQADFMIPMPAVDFFDIDSRRGDIQNSHVYLLGLTDTQLLFFGKDNTSIYTQQLNLNNGNHTAKLCSVGANHSLYIDDNLIHTVVDSTYSSGAPGFDLGNNTPIDNFIVTTPDTNINLNVPLIKQDDPAWSNKLYDSANKWSPKNPFVGTWGCAITSATMVFKFNGLNKLPDGKDLNPDSLNSWLNSQKDGYIGNGLVNWLALARLSKQSVLINNITGFDALQFTKRSPGSLDDVKADLSDNIPDILGEPGHFVVANGFQNDEIQIKDPYYSRTSLSDYDNKITSLNKFTPSHTDLSYIMITYPQGINTLLKDHAGNSVGQSFSEGPLTNPTNANQNNGGPNNFIYFSQPPSDDYHLEITSSHKSDYDIGVYLYDHDGNVLERDEFGSITPGKTNTTDVTFSSQPNFYTTTVDFKDLQKDLDKALSSKKMSIDIYASFKLKGLSAQLQQKTGNKSGELSTLLSIQNELDKSKGKKVLEPSYSKLLYDLNYLQTHL